MSRRLRSADGDVIPFVASSQVLAGNSLAWSPELVQWQTATPESTQQQKQVRASHRLTGTDDPCLRKCAYSCAKKSRCKKGNSLNK